MSKLGSLFGSSSSSSDSSDALKYSAPREPKKNASSLGAAPPSLSASPRATTAPASSAAVPAKPNPPKVMCAATIRLFKVSPSTHAYEAVAGGSPLGCVIIGSGIVFQILAYNGQVVAMIFALFVLFMYALMAHLCYRKKLNLLAVSRQHFDTLVQICMCHLPMPLETAGHCSLTRRML